MFGIIHKLSQKGVLGINKRNAEYALIYNSRHSYPLVDDKLTTKELALRVGISVPELYHVVEMESQIRELQSVLEKYNDFVIKPAHGSGGDGILVIAERLKNMYRLITGTLMNQEELSYHIANILSGIYSLGGHPDRALIEYRVKHEPVFEKVSYLGVPDIRIIVFLGVPVMSMVRLPTRMSRGKANLHQGAIGAGIDMKTGTTLSGVWKNNIITDHPDTGFPIAGLSIPHWDRLLFLAAGCFELTGLGYQGVDIVLDKDKGPLILELNARPGLNIQIANNAGLLHRLALVEKHRKSLAGPDERVYFAVRHFSSLSQLNSDI